MSTIQLSTELEGDLPVVVVRQWTGDRGRGLEIGPIGAKAEQAEGENDRKDMTRKKEEGGVVMMSKEGSVRDWGGGERAKQSSKSNSSHFQSSSTN